MRPKRGDLAFSTGNALKEAGNVAEAAAFYEMALKADPHNPKYMFALALVNRVRRCMRMSCLTAAQMLGQADEDTQALADKSLNSGKPIDHFELGVWMQDEQPTVALMHLKKFLETDPRHPNVRSAVYIMGRIYEQCVLRCGASATDAATAGSAVATSLRRCTRPPSSAACGWMRASGPASCSAS